LNKQKIEDLEKVLADTRSEFDSKEREFEQNARLNINPLSFLYIIVTTLTLNYRNLQQEIEAAKADGARSEERATKLEATLKATNEEYEKQRRGYEEKIANVEGDLAEKKAEWAGRERFLQDQLAK